MRAMVVGLVAAAVAGGWSLGGRSTATAPMSVDEKVQAIATGMNAITPKTLESGVVLQSVRADGATLVARMDGVRDWRPTYSDGEMTRMMAAGICARADVGQVLGQGARLRFELTTPGGASLPTLTIDRCA